MAVPFKGGLFLKWVAILFKLIENYSASWIQSEVTQFSRSTNNWNKLLELCAQSAYVLVCAKDKAKSIGFTCYCKKQLDSIPHR